MNEQWLSGNNEATGQKLRFRSCYFYLPLKLEFCYLVGMSNGYNKEALQESMTTSIFKNRKRFKPINSIPSHKSFTSLGLEKTLEG
jgi:hypothetical protein